MSAPLNLTAEQLRDLGHALEGLTKIRAQHSVTVTPYSTVDVGIGDNVIKVNWDDELEQYVVDDRNGS